MKRSPPGRRGTPSAAVTGALLALALVAVGCLVIRRRAAKRPVVVPAIVAGPAADGRPAAVEPGTVDSRPAQSRSLLRRVASALFTVLTVAALGFWFVALRPLSLGGPANYTVIHGNSMWPLYKDGDLIITKRKATYTKGDVVAYTVPRGEIGAGHLVIHRIIGGSTSTGLELRGDHNPDVDPWHPHLADVAGSTWVQVPRAGKVLALLHQPLPLAGIATAITLVVVLRSKPREDPETVQERATKRG